MKNIFSLFLFLCFFANHSVAQVFPFVDDFSTQVNLTLVRAPWKTKNFNVYARGTGTPASLAVQSGLSTFGRFDSLISPVIGPITSTTQLTFNYRIVGYIGSTPTTVTMVAADNFNVGI